MQLIFFNDKRSTKCRQFMKIEDKMERYEFLLLGKIIAQPWIDTKTCEEFYRPKLNGVSVNDGKKFKRFKTIEAAILEGQRIRNRISEKFN